MSTTAAPAASARAYEILFIALPTLQEADVDRLVADLSDTLASRGASVSLVEKWGRRKLAYRVRKHVEGTYVLLHVAGNGEAVTETERRMRINDSVIAYLTVRIDDVPGAVEAGRLRLVRKAKLEEERATRAAERAASEVAERRRVAEAAGGFDDDDDTFEEA